MAGQLPIILLEEHHEAFYAWNYASRAEWLDTRSATLLHVDEHADMALPRLRRPMASITGLADLADFVYRELTINDFVWPAVYQGHFERLFWMRAQHAPSAGAWRRITISPADRRGLTFSLTTQTPDESARFQSRTIEYAPLTARNSIQPAEPVLLDIDLDYFAWNSHPDLPECRIEVTENTYRCFRDNPYHWLRISPGAKVSAVADDGRFYLIYDDGPRTERTVSEAEVVDQRLDEFFRFLEKNCIKPKAATICRSLHSGYTEKAHSEYIESTLLDRLERLYPGTRVFPIADLLPSSDLERLEVHHACVS